MEIIINEILSEIKPSREHEKKLDKLTKNILSKIKIPDAKAVLGGSGAKGTWLQDAYDIDIYVKFNHSKYKNKNISQILGANLKKKFKISVLHGSRDYYQINQQGFTIEIVPILEIKKAEQAENITDVSQLHVNWVKKNSDKKLRDQIRLVKQFCKAQGCYGAESYIKGFSGYVLEILTIKYGSFNNFMKKVSNWKSKEVIGYKKQVKELNKSKKQSPLILIDPVQDTRNASAALSKEKYQILIKSSKKFLKNPDKKYFHKKKFDIDKLKKQAGKNKLIILNVTPLKRKKDVAGAKLVKCLEYLRKHIELNDFKVKKYGFHWEGNAILYYIMEKDKLEVTKKHFGPPIKDKERMASFRKKWKGKKILKVREKSYVILKRKHTDIDSFLKEFIGKDPNINNMAKKIKKA